MVSSVLSGQEGLPAGWEEIQESQRDHIPPADSLHDNYLLWGGGRERCCVVAGLSDQNAVAT